MSATYRIVSAEESSALALNVVAWTVSDAGRAQRMLDITGLDPQTLRENLTKPATLRAMLDFVLDHEPDLIACARDIGVKPEDIASARRGIA